MASFLGIAAAMVGVRVLGQFLPMETGLLAGPFKDGANAVQLSVFRIVDVVLTALLLAGGADGIHQLVKGFLGKRGELKPGG